MSAPIPPNEEELFSRASDLPAVERAAYLEKACAGDAALRARVEALLRADEAARSFMESPPAADLASALTQQTPRVADAAVGDRIGRYKLLQKLGEGGCGVVYMAEQEEPVRRRVALKVIKLGMDTKEVVARFEAERQALALMDHTHIARVFDGGATDAGRPFFVMELVRGIPITKFCDEQNLPTAKRLELFTQVCHAVQHAHQKGIIHRDLKPSNILVTLHDGVPVPKVIDFGIAKATHGRLTDNTLFTAFEQFIGTPAYMSPEQAEMSGLDIDTRSDIYSLGVLLYELLTGRPPFDPKSLVSAGLDEIRRIIREVEPPRPSTRLSTLTDLERATIAKLRGILPAQLSTLLRGDLDWIVMRCLEKDRMRRYETANALALDVLRHLHDEIVVARPPSAAYRLRKLVRRHRLVFASVTAVALAIVSALVVSLHQYRQEKIARGRAVEAEHQQTLERKKAETARGVAERAEQAASASAANLRRNLYAADIYLAQNLLREEGTHSLAERILRGHVPAPGEPDLRGFEWRHLWAQSQGDKLMAWSGRQGVVRNIVRSPDGRLLATSGRGVLGEPGHACVWDARTHQLLADFKEAECARFSHDGTRLITATRNSHVHVWRVGTWEILREFAAASVESFPNQRIETAVSPTAPLLAICPDGSYNTAQGSARLWNFDSGELLARLEDSGDELAFTPDGRTLVTLRAPGNHIKIWDVATRTLRRTIERATNYHALALTPDSRFVISVTRGAIVSWEIATGAAGPRIEAALPQRTILPMAISPDGRMLATGDIDRKVRLWDFQSGRKLAEFSGAGGWVWAVAFSADGSRVYSGGRDEEISVWPARATPERKPIPTGAEPPFFNQDGRFLVGQNPLGEIVIHGLETYSAGAPLAAGSTPLWLSADGQRLLALRDAAVQSWDVSRRTLLAATPLTPAPTTRGARAISRDGRLLAIALAPGKSVTVWDTATGTAQATFTADKNIEAVALSPDGSLLAVGGLGNYVSLWDLATREIAWGFTPHSTNVIGLRFSPDGRRLATWALNGELQVWDVATRKPMLDQQRFEPSIRSADFTLDGRTLVTLHRDFMKFWHLATRREIASLPTPANSQFTGVGLAPDDRHLWISRKVGDQYSEVVVTPVPSLMEIDSRLAAEQAITARSQIFTTTVRPAAPAAGSPSVEIETENAVARAQRALAAAGATPDSNDAIKARYDLAVELARVGRNEDALREFLWCIDTGMKGRAAFQLTRARDVLKAVAKLGPSGIAALRERRKAALAQLEHTPSNQPAALDYIWLNHALQEDATTLAYVERLPPLDARRRVLVPLAYSVLREAQRYADAFKLRPLATMEREFETRMEAYRAKVQDRTAERAMRDSMIQSVVRDIEVLIGVGQLDAGRALGERIFAIGDPKEVRELLRINARRAGHPELWASSDAK